MKTKIVLSLFLIISLLFPPINISLGYSYRVSNVIDSSWYEIENQPEEALNIVELWIGNKVYRVNDIEKESDVAPVIKDGRTLVPIRVISEGLGASVSWDPVLRKVGIELETLEGIKRVELFVSNNEYFINGESFFMDVPPQIINGRTLVPVRVVSESLDCKVYWDGVERKVTVKGLNLSSDFDFDLLTFKDEYTYHTNPNDKDTDDDLLTDYEEIMEYNTDPLNPDTDGDGLKDNEEVIIYKTDPAKSDTDDDNLTDYDEVREYNTDPLNPDTDGDGLKDNEEVDVGLDPLKDYSNPFSILIHDKDYIGIKKDIDRIINKDAFELFKSVVDKINGIEDEEERISVLGKFLELLNVVQDDEYMMRDLGKQIEKRGIGRIDEIKGILNKKKRIYNLIDSFYKNRDEKLKENFFTFLYPKIEDEDTVLTYNRIESFFSFVSSLPDELKDYELNTFLFFEDGKIDKEEEEFIDSYVKDKEDENNITLARKVIDSYFAKIPSDDPNKFDFIEELKNLPSYKEVTPEESINLLESYEDIISLYLKGKPYEKFEDRFKEKITKQHEIWEGFDLMLRGGDYRQLEGEKDFEIMRNYANQIKFDGKGDDWENYPFLQSDIENDLNIMPPEGVEKDSVDIISYAFLRDDDYVYVFYKTKGKPAEDPNISWRFRVRLNDNQWCEIDEGHDRIYISRYDNNKSYGHYELTPKEMYLKVGDVVEYRIPLSNMWNFKEMNNIYFELWVRNLVSEKDIDMDTGYGKLGAIFTYKIPEFNTQLSLLYYLTTNTELKLFDTLSISDAISNGIFLTIGDDEVKKVSSKDSLDLLLYLREVNEWQKKVGIYPLEDLPLLEKMFLTFRIDDNFVYGKNVYNKYSLSVFTNYKMNIKAYKWLTTEISTLKEMKDFMEQTILPKSGTHTKILANILDAYFSWSNEHWLFTLKYNEEEDGLEEYLPDMIIDGEKINPHNFNNNDFIWRYFKEHGKGIGVCDDEASFVAAILKSIGVSSWTITWHIRYKFKGELHGAGHQHVIYYSPEKRAWFSPMNQLRIDRGVEYKEGIILLHYYTYSPSFDIYNDFKLIILHYNIKTFEELKKKFYDEGMPEAEMKRFIYDNLFPDYD